jgi:hypothetical protein
MWTILFFNDKIPHPSFYTLSSIIGICLIIWFSQKNEPVYKLLSSKLFVGIGVISYSSVSSVTGLVTCGFSPSIISRSSASSY